MASRLLVCWVERGNFKGDRYYHAQLGQDRGRYFYMYEEALLEMGDGWAPIYKVIVEEWRWRDTGAPLE